MPKPVQKLQEELGGDIGNNPKFSIPMTNPADQYPRIISESNTGGAVEKTIPATSPSNFRSSYDETRDPETNLHDQYVHVDTIEVEPGDNFPFKRE